MRWRSTGDPLFRKGEENNCRCSIYDSSVSSSSTFQGKREGSWKTKSYGEDPLRNPSLSREDLQQIWIWRWDVTAQDFHNVREHPRFSPTSHLVSLTTSLAFAISLFLAFDLQHPIVGDIIGPTNLTRWTMTSSNTY